MYEIFRVKELNIDQLLLQIKKETAVSGDYEQACNKLQDLGLDDKLVRDLFDDFLKEASAYFQIDILQKIDINSQEIIMLLYAISDSKDKDAANRIRENEKIMHFVSSDSVAKEIWNNII